VERRKIEPRIKTKVIDLSSKNGTQSYLLRLAKRLSKKVGYDKEATAGLLYLMENSNKEAFINIFEDHFDEYITFVNKEC